MWFADIAKRATELQEQATHLASAKTLFNLDGLQQGHHDEGHDDETTATTPTTTRTAATVAPTSQKAAAAEETETSTSLKSAAATGGASTTSSLLFSHDKVTGILKFADATSNSATIATGDFINNNNNNNSEANKCESSVSAKLDAEHHPHDIMKREYAGDAANTPTAAEEQEEQVNNVDENENDAGVAKDGWGDDEAEEIFDFDSSDKDEQQQQQQHIFDDDDDDDDTSKVVAMDQTLEHQEPLPVISKSGDTTSPTPTTELENVETSGGGAVDPIVNANESIQEEETFFASSSPPDAVDPSQNVTVSHITELDKMGEPADDNVVFNDDDDDDDDDDGLDDMYEDDETEQEGKEKEQKDNGSGGKAMESSSETKPDQVTAQPEPLELKVREAPLQVSEEKKAKPKPEDSTGGKEEPNLAVIESVASAMSAAVFEMAQLVSNQTTTPNATVKVDEPLAPVAGEEQSVPTEQSSEHTATAPPNSTKAKEIISTDTAKVTSGSVDDAATPPSDANVQHPQHHADNAMADRLLEQFSQQMQRLDENHQAELRERDQQHALELERLVASFNHDKCEEQRREMEERLMEKLRAKEQQVVDLLKTSEGHKLKIDVLKRELDGTRQIMAEKESAVGTVHAARENDIKDLERKLKQKDADIAAAKERHDKLAAELKEVKNELESTNDSYSTLKARVKVVATELKDRRVECRNLGIEVAELTESNEGLKTQVANLQSQLADQNRSQSEKDEESEQLRSNVTSLENRLRVAEKSIKEADAVNEKALAAYKKKAQAALAEANARAAAASQAREEAELEARAARSTADAAMERARVAEAAGKEAIAEAKSYVKDLEDEKLQVEEEVKELRLTLNSTKEQLNQVRSELKESLSAQEKLSRDLEQMCRNLEAERAKSQELEEDLCDSRRRSNELHDQLEMLREDLQRSSTAGFGKSAYSDPSGLAGKNATEYNGHNVNLSVKPTDKSDAEATIIMLQQELSDANRAIKELKETLRVTIDQQAEHSQTTNVVAPELKSNGFHTDSSEQGYGSTPLYFAMEKQAELNLARDEINRLANLLGDAESSKMEAFEAMEEMRRKMEEAEARLRRFEKMGSAAGRGRSSQDLHPALIPRDGNLLPGVVNDMSMGRASGNDETIVDSAVVNLEYLKNVMLSYLNAKTTHEKKALVPVIGAVLCLTAQEQSKAVKAIEDSGGIEGVGQALLESFGSGRLF